MSAILEIKDLSVEIDGGTSEDSVQILKNVSMTIGAGETHVLMGPNGAGKSTLGYTLMGNEKYKVTSGEIIFKGQDLLSMNVNERCFVSTFFPPLYTSR